MLERSTPSATSPKRPVVAVAAPADLVGEVAGGVVDDVVGPEGASRDLIAEARRLRNQ
ncbi:MAG: hypothetical protein J0I34_26940 [Pseudonocardia sp.]|uniref:hypothetical protein n=1 Tax=unclassified Pseudonocardia TaxID=2619320 RepID=UPI001AD0D130|nr:MULTISPECIES: hypothetical protein [unclassified Pseudonocardia]MBN9112410.1 hypothetical protein [Pseudonocardia sp.]